MSGGMSTGPRTPEGLERSRRALKARASSRDTTRELLANNRRRWRAHQRFATLLHSLFVSSIGSGVHVRDAFLGGTAFRLMSKVNSSARMQR
jgi:hypothetical protein